VSTEFKITTAQSLSGVVQLLEDFTGSYGPSYKIAVDVDGDVFNFIEKKERVDKALQDVSLNRETVIGRSVKFWKRPMPEDPKKGYLNVDLLDTGRQAIKPPFVPKAAVVTPEQLAKSAETLPAWLDKDAKEGQIKETARADLDWAWNVAWGIMAPKIEGSGAMMGDPMVIQATQAAAVALAIRLEHARR